MNDFGNINIKGLMAVLKSRNYYKKPSTVAERTLKVVSGSGCDPEPAMGRKIDCKRSDGIIESISSYDLEYVIDENGKKIFHIEPKTAEADICPISITPLLVKRKR